MTSPNRKFSPFRIFASATASCLLFVGACGGGGGEDKGPNAESSSENATGDSASTQESQSSETPSGGDCVLELTLTAAGLIFLAKTCQP